MRFCYVSCLLALGLVIFACETRAPSSGDRLAPLPAEGWQGAKLGDSVVIENVDILDELAGPVGRRPRRSCWVMTSDRLTIVKIVGDHAAARCEPGEANLARDSSYCATGSIVKVHYLHWRRYLEANEELAKELEENRRLLEGVVGPAEKP